MRQRDLKRINPEWPKSKEALQAALTRAAKDSGYRDRCMCSSRSAKEAITEESGIPVPDDIEIHFYPRKELDYLFIVEVPDFDPNAPVPPVEDYVLCTWPQY
jgi:hypothetical protein